MSDEFVVEMLQDDEMSQLAKILEAISARVEVEIDVDFGATPVAEVMKLRGALAAGGEMMAAGMADLLTAGIREDLRLQFVLGLWQMGAEATVKDALAACDEWLMVKKMPMVSLYEVDSSNIAAMGWAGFEGETVAVVEFKSGSLYAYDGVPENVFHEWWNADSRGVYLSREIKGVYPFRRL